MEIENWETLQHLNGICSRNEMRGLHGKSTDLEVKRKFEELTDLEDEGIDQEERKIARILLSYSTIARFFWNAF